MTATTRLIFVLTVMASGRAMTLAFVGRAGDGGAGDPPAAWLMPLVGDAAIGIVALFVAGLIWRHRSPATWAIAIAWSAIGAFDAFAAYLVDLQTPWPEFFMLELFGRSMFFAAIGLHVIIIVLLARPEVKSGFDVGDHMTSRTRSASQPI